MSMQNKKVYIATELAKKEMKLKKEDYEKQEVLAKLKVKSDENLEDINSFVSKMTGIIAKNGEGQLLSELQFDILVNLEQRVMNNEISSIEGMNSAQTIKDISNYIINSNKDYLEQLNNSNKEQVNSTNIAALTFMEFIAKSMTLEEIEAYESEYRKSEGYKKAVTSSMDNLFDAKTYEEKEQAAINIQAIELSRKSDDYCIQNKGTKSDRAILLKIFRFVGMGTPEMLQEAAIKAKKMGFDIIKEDGTIDLDATHKIFIDTYTREGEQVPERFSTVDNVFKTLEKSAKARAKSTINKYEKNEKFKNMYEQAKTPNDKMDVIKLQEERELKKRDLISRLNVALVSSDNNYNYRKIMKELVSNSPEESKQILLNMASKGDKKYYVKVDIISFVNDVYGKDKENDKNAIEPSHKSLVDSKLKNTGDER